MVAALVWTTLAVSAFTGWGLVAAGAGMAISVLAFRAFYCTTLARRLWTSIGLFAVLEARGLRLRARRGAGARNRPVVCLCHHRHGAGCR